MKPHIKDTKGDLVTVGCTVAFNRSGEVMLGKVVKIVPTKKQWSHWSNNENVLANTFHVQLLDSPNTISKVRRSRNMLVIYDKDGVQCL